MRARHDEREKRDGQDEHERMCDVQSPTFQKLRTSDLEPSPVSLVPPVSPAYPAQLYF